MGRGTFAFVFVIISVFVCAVVVVGCIVSHSRTDMFHGQPFSRPSSTSNNNRNHKKKKTKQTTLVPSAPVPPPPSKAPLPGVWCTIGSDHLHTTCRRPIPTPFEPDENDDGSIRYYDSIPLGLGRVTAWCPGLDRIPDLYRVDYGEYYTEHVTLEELVIGQTCADRRLAVALNSTQLEQGKDRIRQYHAHRAKSHDRVLRERLTQRWLPALCGVASREMDTHAEWKRCYEEEVRQFASSGVVSSEATRPRYYGHRPPQAYHRDAVAAVSNVVTVSTTNNNNPSYTSAQINARLKLGGSLAWDYCRRRDEPAPRRTTRRLADAELETPKDYEPGGRVARWLLELLGQK